MGAIPESLRYWRVRHSVKMKMQESVTKGETQSAALSSSSVFFNRIVLYVSVLTKDCAIARQYTALVKVSRQVRPSDGSRHYLQAWKAVGPLS